MCSLHTLRVIIKCQHYTIELLKPLNRFSYGFLSRRTALREAHHRPTVVEALADGEGINFALCYSDHLSCAAPQVLTVQANVLAISKIKKVLVGKA